ncbi:hypothetical protein Hanom_Chr09g00778341 [Helianthus anomalus]
MRAHTHRSAYITINYSPLLIGCVCTHTLGRKRQKRVQQKHTCGTAQSACVGSQRTELKHSQSSV